MLQKVLVFQVILLRSGKSGTPLEVLKLKLWINDLRPAPEGYFPWIRSVNGAKQTIEMIEYSRYLTIANERTPTEIDTIELIDIDYDAGDYASYGGDYIKLLDWLEETGRNYPIRIHSTNPVDVENMRQIIQRNNWKEVL